MLKLDRVRAVNVDVVEKIAESHRDVLEHFKATVPSPKADLHQWALDAANRYKTTHPKAFRYRKKRQPLDFMEDVYLPLKQSARALRDVAALRKAAREGAWEDDSVHRLLSFCAGRGAVLQELFVGSPDRTAKAKGAIVKRRAYADLVRQLLPDVMQEWNRHPNASPTALSTNVIRGLADHRLDWLAQDKARNEDRRETIRDNQAKKLAALLRRIDLKKVARLLQQLDTSKRPDRQREVASKGFSGEPDYYEWRLQQVLLGPADSGDLDSPVTQERIERRFKDVAPFVAMILGRGTSNRVARRRG